MVADDWMIESVIVSWMQQWVVQSVNQGVSEWGWVGDDGNWYQDWGHCGVTNDLGSSPRPEGQTLGLWWASQIVGDTTMTDIEVSIFILSWRLKAYWIYADSDMYKQKIAHKAAFNLQICLCRKHGHRP